MTTLNHNDIINGVLRLMDEHGGNAQFMSGNAMDETKRVIEQVAENAVSKLHLQAPVAMLDGVSLGKPITDWRNVNGRYACIVMLPDGTSDPAFLRLITCKMETWTRPVSHLWWEDSAEYAKQKNKYLMNTRERPAAFYVHHGIVTTAELFSSDDMEDEVREFVYAPKPHWVGDDMVYVSDRLKDSCLMQIAADTLVVLGESERAQQMQALATKAIDTYGGMERHYADNGNRIER